MLFCNPIESTHPMGSATSGQWYSHLSPLREAATALHQGQVLLLILSLAPRMGSKLQPVSGADTADDSCRNTHSNHGACENRLPRPPHDSHLSPLCSGVRPLPPQAGQDTCPKPCITMHTLRQFLGILYSPAVHYVQGNSGMTVKAELSVLLALLPMFCELPGKI